MARLVILGTSGAVNDAQHDYTHFLLIGDSGTPILIDAGSNPLGKIKDLGFGDEELQHIILTHFHPDHVSGFPNMLMHMWLLGRIAPMTIYAIPHCLNRVKQFLAYHSWENLPNFFPMTYKAVSERNHAPVLENEDFIITSWPVNHFIPNVGLRIENKVTGKVLAYSCDTEPTPSLLELCANADLLLHEAGGNPPGHSTGKMAGETASAVNAKKLLLIHYEVWNKSPQELVPQAQSAYNGPVVLCEDMMEFEF